MDAVAPGVTEGFHLLRLAGDVRDVAVLHIAVGGAPLEVAQNYAEMGAAMRSGEMASDYINHPPAQFGKTKFEAFAPVFAAVYAQS